MSSRRLLFKTVEDGARTERLRLSEVLLMFLPCGKLSVNSLLVDIYSRFRIVYEITADIDGFMEEQIIVIQRICLNCGKFLFFTNNN